MSQPELVKLVVTALESAGVEYMLTGSVVSSLQGEPRATHDIDIVVALPLSAVERLVSMFPPPEFYVSAEAAREAIHSQRTFNLLHVTTGDKVDFWLLTESPFDRSRFERRCDETVFGLRAKVSRPDDTILAKLLWAKLSGGSEKQFLDAVRVYEVQHDVLDHQYVDRWARELDVTDLLARLRIEAKPL